MLKAKIARITRRLWKKELIRKNAIDIGVASQIIASHKGYQKFIINGHAT